MPEHIDERVESEIDYYLRATKNRLVIQNQLQQLAINQFNLSDRQIAEFRLKIYQLNMQARYSDSAPSGSPTLTPRQDTDLNEHST